MSKTRFVFILVITIIILIAIPVIYIGTRGRTAQFDGQRAYDDVKKQLSFGPRTLDSTAHAQAVEWITSQLKEADWQVETQETVLSGQPVVNIIAKRGEGSSWIIIGSHYDSRPTADRDPNPANRKLPVPGANDGASSTAALLELARVIPQDLEKQVWLVFFDAEDTGSVSGAGWANGSEYFVSQLQGKPDSVIVLDMIGDKNLDIYMEGNSDESLNREIWGVAKQLGYSQFIPQYKYNIIDDHIPFVNAGIRAADVIDFNYPAWHTTSDTIDQISPESLKVVGDTILKWLLQVAGSTSRTQ
jgi:glutaminyl-peptide cyclotransferase